MIKCIYVSEFRHKMYGRNTSCEIFIGCFLLQQCDGLVQVVPYLGHEDSRISYETMKPWGHMKSIFYECFIEKPVRIYSPRLLLLPEIFGKMLGVVSVANVGSSHSSGMKHGLELQKIL